MALADVARLTREQAAYLYHHARDEDNRLVPYGPPESARRAAAGRGEREEFFDHYQLLGFALWRIEQLWRQRQQGNDGRAARR